MSRDTPTPSDLLAILANVSPDFTTQPFRTELPRLLEAKGLTLRALARDVGGFDHAYLSRMLHGQVPVNVQHVRKISKQLGLPPDYFPEVREAAVTEAVRKSSKLRDEIYFGRLDRTRRT